MEFFYVPSEEVVLRIGDDVTIGDGPFAGLIGQLTGLSDQRVYIAVQLHGHRISVEMERDWISSEEYRRKSITSYPQSDLYRRRSDLA
jgi:hypothetical protein